MQDIGYSKENLKVHTGIPSPLLSPLPSFLSPFPSEIHFGIPFSLKIWHLKSTFKIFKDTQLDT